MFGMLSNNSEIFLLVHVIYVGVFHIFNQLNACLSDCNMFGRWLMGLVIVSSNGIANQQQLVSYKAKLVMEGFNK